MSKMKTLFEKKYMKILTITVCIVLVLALALVLLFPVIVKESYIRKFGQENYHRFSHLQVGDYVTFGAYEQDRDNDNGAEAVEWLVLAVERDKALLISRYVLDCVPYSTFEGDTTWEKSYIRGWLNGKFLKTAFSEQEQMMIPGTKVEPDRGQTYGFDPGPATYDQVSLLSYEEVNRYFPDNESRRCQATSYAKLQGIIASVEDDTCWWWLRSAGNTLFYASYVLLNGYAYAGGCKVVSDFVGVRPAIWVEIPIA